MVRNINKTPGGFSRAIQWIQPAGDKVLFNAYSSEEGNELWVSNGTRRGTKLLKDIRPGVDGSLTPDAVVMGDFVYFGANDGIHGFELWRSDGSAQGTQMVADMVPGPGSGAGTTVFAHEGVVYCRGESLWASDGSAQGSVELNPPDPITGDRRFETPRAFAAFGASTYFLTDEAAVWKSDGTSGGTVKVGDVGPQGLNYASEMKVAGDLLFVVGGSDVVGGAVIWVMAPSSEVLATLNAPEGTPPWDQIEDIGVHGDLFFFTPLRFDDGKGDLEMSFWVSDGSPAGTRQLLPHLGYSPISWKGRLYFSTRSDDSRWRIWRSDGTIEGTVPIEEFGEGANQLWAKGDVLHFAASDGMADYLWSSDGTAQGTKRIRQLAGSSYSNPFSVIGDDLYFADETGTYDSNLFRVSGKRASAAQLTRNEKMDLSALDLPDPTTATTKSGQVYFTAVARDAVHDIWRSNGTFTGTRRVWRAPTNEQNYVSILGSFGDQVLFYHSDAGQGLQLSSISGKKDRTQVLGDLEGWFPSAPVIDAGTLGYFTIRTHTSNQLWRTDGTPEGTFQVFTPSGVAAAPEEDSLALLNGILYFIEENRIPAAALWRTDGTMAGTWPVREFTPANVDQIIRISGLSKVGNRLVFLRYANFEGGGVWTSDGTFQGTLETGTVAQWRKGGLVNSCDLGGLHLFLLRNFEGDLQWWRSDGTPAGTYVIHDLTELGFGVPQQTLVVGDKLFFVTLASGKYELWKTEGTANSLARVRDDLTVNGPLIAHVGRVYFSGSNGNGWQSWMSDGTGNGTMIVDDHDEDSPCLAAFPLISTGKRLFYKGYDRRASYELHVLIPPKQRR